MPDVFRVQVRPGDQERLGEWRIIPGFPLYEINREAVIRFRSTGRVRKQQPADGYRRVRLQLELGNKRSRTVGVHHLLALAFIPRPEGATLVRHLNDVRWDNRLENLAWGTEQDNAQDMVRNGHHGQASKTHCKRGHLLEESSPGRWRQCRVCRAQLERERYAAGRIYTRKDGRAPLSPLKRESVA